MPKKILVVEDEELISNTLKALLDVMKIEYKNVSNGKEGLKAFKTDNYDLIITDIFMPEMDGFKLIEEIREINKNIPIIVISGYIDNETIRKIKQIGANEYIEKPFSIKEVKTAIIRIIGE